jgi:hypothetical protein
VSLLVNYPLSLLLEEFELVWLVPQVKFDLGEVWKRSFLLRAK